MTDNGNTSYLPYLNKLVHQYNNAYYHCTNKKLVNADYSELNKKIKASSS